MVAATPAAVIGGPVAGYAPLPRAPVDPPQRRCPVDRRAPTPSATSSSSSATSRRWPRAARGTSSRSTTCPCASPAGRPPPRPRWPGRGSPTTGSPTAWPTTRSWSAGAACRPASCRPSARRRVWSARCSPAVADRPRPAATAWWWWPGRPTSTRPASGRGPSWRHAAPPGHLHHQLGQLPVPEEEDRRRAPDGHRARASLPGLRLVANNQESAGGPSSGCATASPATAPTAAAAFDELTAPAATARPGSGGLLFTPWLAGERSPVDDRRPGAASTTCPCGPPGAELVRSVLEGVALNSRWLARVGRALRGPSRSGRSGPSGGGAASDLWCSIYARRARPARSSRWPTRCWPTCGAPPSSPGWRLGAVGPDEVRGARPGGGRPPAGSGRVAVYDRLAAEFPALYLGPARDVRPPGRLQPGPRRRPPVGRRRSTAGSCGPASGGGPAPGGPAGIPGPRRIPWPRRPAARPRSRPPRPPRVMPRLWARSTTVWMMVVSWSGEPRPATKLRSTLSRSMGRPCR